MRKRFAGAFVIAIAYDTAAVVTNWLAAGTIRIIGALDALVIG